MIQRTYTGLMVMGVILGAGIAPAAAQENAPPAIRAGTGAEAVRLDGSVDEPAWSTAEMVDRFTQTDPKEGTPATFRTTVRVLTSRNAIVIGITCLDSDPAGIVSYSVRRDAALGQEDNVRIVLGPFQDGRSGYVFAVNPSGARFDSLVSANGDSESAEWDGIWEAATMRNADGWSAEVRIPMQTLSFKPELHEWHFNVERRVQRLLEVDRWASPLRQARLSQTSRAGLLTGLPDFALGRGLTLRPSVTTGGGVSTPSGPVDGEFQPSFDVTQRLGANVNASFTMNTDFAETEVDTRQTNLTRFPLFFQEKRSFFLEGLDIFQFGPVVNTDMMPYFSRRIGLVNGREVPIVAGGKVNGRIASTNFVGLVVRTDSKPGVVAVPTTLAVGRIKQNLWRESYVGLTVTSGDPIGRTGSWLTGVDFTYATSRFLGNKNLYVSAWGALSGSDGLRGDTASYAAKFDYPNDTWDMRLWYKRIGRDFDPSLGFVPRRGVQRWNPAVSNRTRLARGPIQEMSFGQNTYITTDLAGEWETIDSTLTLINWRFRSGDRVQFNLLPTGDRPRTPFEISPGVTIAPGPYTWLRRSLGFTTAQKRRIYTSLTRTFGGFYDGDLGQWEWSAVWNPTALFTVEVSAERNSAELLAGRFTQDLVSTRLRVNLSPDLSVNSYVQYDTDSDSVGLNSRVRWTFLPVADLFIVYNYNVRSLLDRWQLEANQLLVKLQYAWRM